MSHEKGDIIILETYPFSESPYDGLTGVYNTIKGLGTNVSDTSQMQGKRVLVCGIPTLYKQLSPSNTNVIFTTFESDQLPNDWINSINQYHYCLVPHEEVKKVFINSGINIPIHVIQQGFSRYKRLNEKIQFQNFNVGFLGVPVKRKNLHKLYDACKSLQNTNIPTIKLVIHVAAFYDWLDEKEFAMIKEDSMVNWSAGKYTFEQISEWYNNLSCYIFPSSGEGWSFTPRESMYMRIPTIISDIPVHKELSESGFYKTIMATQKEPANFNGPYYGSWKKIEKSKIACAILNVYDNYPHYQLLAREGGEWIENKWLNKDLSKSLLNFFDSI